MHNIERAAYILEASSTLEPVEHKAFVEALTPD